MNTLQTSPAALTASDVPELIDAVRESYAKISGAEGAEAPVAGYLVDDAERFVATRAVSGEALSHNAATAKALLGAVRYLDSYYDAQVCA